MSPPPLSPASGAAPPMPRRQRQRYRSRPLAPLDEARRNLSQVEMQRAAADAAQAETLNLIGQNLGRLADAAERYINHCHTSVKPGEAFRGGSLADAGSTQRNHGWLHRDLHQYSIYSCPHHTPM